MDKINKTEIKNLFSNLCCSRCKNDFGTDSFEVVDAEGDILIVNLKCTKCGKDFGEIVLNYNRKSKKHLPLEVVEGLEPISYDDVIDAHRFIKSLKQSD